MTGGGIAGFEILFAPRLKAVATYVFGGFEFEASVSLGDLSTPKLLHGEVGAFIRLVLEHEESGWGRVWSRRCISRRRFYRS